MGIRKLRDFKKRSRIEELEKIIELYRSEQIVISLVLDYIVEKFNINRDELDKYVREKISQLVTTNEGEQTEKMVSNEGGEQPHQQTDVEKLSE